MMVHTASPASLNYRSHYLDSSGVPPNVNFQCTSAGGSVGGGTLPCAIGNFSNVEPSFITFDLSFGYNTGDKPANTYLRNLTIQLTIQNLMDRLSHFDYTPPPRRDVRLRPMICQCPKPAGQSDSHWSRSGNRVFSSLRRPVSEIARWRAFF